MKHSTAGYSGKPLSTKLGIKPGFRVKTGNAPAHYMDLLGTLPAGAKVSPRLKAPVDVWHFFSTSRKALASKLPQCLEEIHRDGMIWASWPKKSSGRATDVDGNAIRALAFPLGLVDVKVCAVDEVWSALKLVIRKENR